jgi:hypothetical protein
MNCFLKSTGEDLPSTIKNFAAASEGNLKRENKISDCSCI